MFKLKLCMKNRKFHTDPIWIACCVCLKYCLNLAKLFLPFFFLAIIVKLFLNCCVLDKCIKHFISMSKY